MLDEMIASLEPSENVIEMIRMINIFIGLGACLVLLGFLALPRWNGWSTRLRLGWMALFLLVFTGTYGTFEIQYLESHLRVPMVTVSLLWAILAAVWPEDKDKRSSGKG